MDFSTILLLLLGLSGGFVLSRLWYGNRERYLQRQVIQGEERERHQEERLREQMLLLRTAQDEFRLERDRLRSVSEEEQQRLLEERDRLWSQFEQRVVGSLRMVLEDKRIGLPYYTNTKLPMEFSGKYKPDMLIAVGEQYVVVDAKISKGDSLQTYIKDQVKKTAEKMQGMKQLFPVVYFVVPLEQMGDLNETVYYEGSWTFCVITKEVLFSVVYQLKQMVLHDEVGAMDPALRKELVTTLAQLYHHVDAEQAVHAIMAERGAALGDTLSQLEEGMREEVYEKKHRLRVRPISGVAIRERVV